MKPPGGATKAKVIFIELGGPEQFLRGAAQAQSFLIKLFRAYVGL